MANRVRGGFSPPLPTRWDTLQGKEQSGFFKKLSVANRLPKYKMKKYKLLLTYREGCR